MAERRTRSAWAFGLSAAALLQFSLALEDSLARLHAPLLKDSAGYRQLADGGQVENAWKIWKEGEAALAAFEPASPTWMIGWHVATETVGVLFLLAALAAALRLPGGVTVKQRVLTLWGTWWSWSRWLVFTAGLDLLGNATEVWILLSPGTRRTAASFGGVLWWGVRIGLGVTLLLLIVQKKDAIRRVFSAIFRAPAVLRVLLGLDLALVAILYSGAIGSQTEDIVQRWGDGEGLIALAAYLTFAVVVWTGRWLLPVGTDHKPLALLGVGAVLTAAGLAVFLWEEAGRGAGLLVLGVIVVLIGVAEWLAPPSEHVDTVQKPQVRAWVAAIPALAIGLLLVRTAANEAVVGDQPWLLLPAGVALGLAAVAWHLCGCESKPLCWPRSYYLLQAGAVAATAYALADSGEGGSFAVLLFALAALAALALAVRAIFLSERTPRAFSAFGFTRAPAVTVVVAWIAIASAVNGASNDRPGADRITYYDARTTQRDRSAIGERVPVDSASCEARVRDVAVPTWLREDFCRWVTARTREREGSSTIPLVLVTASGGGVRAAAWTEKVLDCLFLRDDPVNCTDGAQRIDRFPLLYAANGASGGSVGIASTVVERLVHDGRVPPGGPWWREHQHEDTLTPLIGRALVFDTFLGMFGIFRGEDRATALENSWQERWSDAYPKYCLGEGTGGAAPKVIDLGFTSLRGRCARPLPLMLFNGTDVKSGRRVNLAPVNADTSPPGSALGPIDLIHYLGGDQDLPLFTAAFLSARFPLVTPSGRLPSCRVPNEAHDRKCPKTSAGSDVVNVVDGGYAENDGAAQVAELWPSLQLLVEAYNRAAGVPVRLVLVQIENGEQSSARRMPQASTIGEIFRPVGAILNVGARGRSGAIDALTVGLETCLKGADPPPGPVHVRFSMYEHPGRTLPLGWTLSEHSLNSIEQQFRVELNQDAATCFNRVTAK